MTFAEQWFALATNIKSLTEAGELYSRFQSYHQEDSYGAGRYLHVQCGEIVKALEQFRTDFASVLPPRALERLDAFLASGLANAAKDPSGDQRNARGALVGLVALEAEISFILAGRQEVIRARSERAFILLQRLLAVDDDLKVKWKKAFKSGGEVACEKLGAVHLLSQGIFAFKVDAAGARTDLVFPEIDETLLVRSTDGLVLTEWKKATAADAPKKFSEAKDQAEKYSEGALAGIELVGYRYLVTVSEKELASVPADIASPKGYAYRHINIAIDPTTPSRAVRVGRKKGGS